MTHVQTPPVPQATARTYAAAQLRVRISRTGDLIVVYLAGELDLATVDELRAVLQSQTNGPVQPRRIVVDLAEVAFLDAATVGVLVRAYANARRAGVDLMVRNAYGVPRLVLTLTGVAEHLGLTTRSSPRTT